MLCILNRVYNYSESNRNLLVSTEVFKETIGGVIDTHNSSPQDEEFMRRNPNTLLLQERHNNGQESSLIIH